MPSTAACMARLIHLSSGWTSFGSRLRLPRMLLPGLCLAIIVTLCGVAKASSGDVTLTNDSIQLSLGVTSQGVPVIQDAKRVSTGDPVFTDLGLPGGLSAWAPADLIVNQKAKPSTATWELSDSDSFHVAKATRGLGRGVQITWVVELAKRCSLIRLHVILTNAGNASESVDWFPGWNAQWQLPGTPTSVRWWDALTFETHEKNLASNDSVNFSNHSYSAADGGTNPFWVIKGPWGDTYFGIGWSGGWQANLSFSDGQLGFTVMLPQTETQLVLKPGEAIQGPGLEIVPVRETSEYGARRSWMKSRAELAKGPAASFPLTYNHWYAIKTDVDVPFLNNQTAALTTYGFDNFVIDAGWYDDAGDWDSDGAKFQPGELEGLMQTLKASGHVSGLWSAPQWVSTSIKHVQGKLEQPAIFSRFLQADLLDLWHSHYADLVVKHVQDLRSRFAINYWKYDQPIFIDKSKAGAMRNVIAFQEGLKAVRAANPDLAIENCEDGGHLINEFTLLNTQFSWLEDDGDTGLAGARNNIRTALGALDFVFPWSALRFTSLFDQMDQTDDELTRYYCRSAMMGVWGISSDLSKVSPNQQAIVLGEIQNYRRLNEIKKEVSYELRQPVSGIDSAGATFYGRQGKRAAVLCFRWGAQGAFTSQTSLAGLDPSQSYQVTDVDTGLSNVSSGQDLVKIGLSMPFSPTRMSGLVFIDPVAK